MHFVALFSKKASAIPIIASHGWPGVDQQKLPIRNYAEQTLGSFLEFLPIMSLARKQYTPETMPYHFIAPSLPGYTLSSSSGPTKPLTVEQATRILNSLMLNLGFASGYVAQGGDVGSSVARTMGAKHEACKAVHLNYCSMRAPPAHIPVESLDTKDRAFVERGQAFKAKGSAYAQEHGTRPATIGFVLSSNPLALLAWIGEKFLEWTDEDPSIDEILEVVSMYWFTDTISRCLYPYRQTMDGQRAGHDDPSLHIRKPFGYSLFPKEVNPTPRSWAATTGNLSWFRQHESGGHFAALEKPEALKQDIEDFLRHVQDQGVPLGRKE